MSNIPANVSRAFRDWLDQNPEGETKLVQGGLRPGQIARLKDGTFQEQLISVTGRTIQTVTGLDLQQLLFENAKQELWGQDDQLPKVTSYTELIVRLQLVVEQRGTAFVVGPLNLHHDREPLRNWFSGKGRMGTDRIKTTLRLILAAQNNQPLEADKRVQPQRQLKQKKQEQKKVPPTSQTPTVFSDDRLRSIIGSFLSTMNSQLNIIDNVVADPVVILDGDRMHITRIASRLLNIFRIDEAVFNRLKTAGAVTDFDSEIIRALTDFTERRKR